MYFLLMMCLKNRVLLLRHLLLGVINTNLDDRDFSPTDLVRNFKMHPLRNGRKQGRCKSFIVSSRSREPYFSVGDCTGKSFQ